MACDHYKTLGLSRGVSAERVRERFHELALRHHPDRAGDEQTARFQAIVEAYQALCRSEGQKRHDHGTQIPVRQTPPRQPASPGPEPEPLVGGQPVTSRGGSPGATLQEPVDAELVLDAADIGRPMQVLLTHPAPCPSCTFHVLRAPLHTPGEAPPLRARGGDLFCPTCGGLGQFQLRRAVRLELPPEIRPGMVIPVEIPGLGRLRVRLWPRFW